jgi:peptidoglycan/xylan/chitin deacetylase (PgdA/CDA1 family)
LATGDVLARAQEEIPAWRGALPATSGYAINVFAIGSESAYTLSIEAGPAPTMPADETERPAASEGTGAIVYLTFDDGPLPPYTYEMLDLLARYGAHATFFALGQNAQKYGELLDAAYAEGHALANHTWSHRSLAGIDFEGFRSEVDQTAAVLGERGVPCMRPPYGATDSFTRAYAAELGYEVILWNVDTLDWSRPGVDEIVRAVVDQVYPGAIVLMHDGGGDREQTVAALEAVLRALTDQGYTLAALCAPGEG